MTKLYRAKIAPVVGGPGVWVEVQANDTHQAKKLIISLYAPRGWFKHPVRVA